MIEVVESANNQRWRAILSNFERVDVCHFPEYHGAYTTREGNGKALLWSYAQGAHQFAYPFLLSPVTLKGPNGNVDSTPYNDISGIYGFSGPLATTNSESFLEKAWAEFDKWCQANHTICEFIRFSIWAENSSFAHQNCKIEPNRPISIALLPESSETYLKQVSSKTRNMIRRAGREGMVCRSLDIKESLPKFRQLYTETMERNGATDFFSYDDQYFENLLQLPRDEINLIGVFKQDEMVAAAIGLISGRYGFYHLGASDYHASRNGAGNLVLFGLASDFIHKRVEFFNVGGGRTTKPDDPLFNFKKNNGTAVSQFYIGKRIIDHQGYNDVVQRWDQLYDSKEKPDQIQFYR